MIVSRQGERTDLALFAALTLGLLAVYGMTLLPGIGRGDIAEFQRVAPTLGLAHPTGYPFYTLLGWAWSHLPLGGTAAWRMNLFSAATTGLGAGVMFLCGRELAHRRTVAIATSVLLAVSFTIWSQATQAEVYGLAVLLQALLIWALLRWRKQKLPLWLVGLVAGLGLAHHRTLMLLLPGVLAFIVSTRRVERAEAAQAVLALLVPSLFYLYVPWRAPAGEGRWKLLLEYSSGEMARQWLDLAQLRAEGIARPSMLVEEYVWPQLLPGSMLLALLGIVRLLRFDRPMLLLSLPSYLLVFAFSTAYYVFDVEVFLIPAHVFAALLIGEGVMLISGWTPHRVAQAIGCLLLLGPALLLRMNWRPIQKANSPLFDQAAHAIMAEPLPPNAVIIGDWQQTEPLHYLQAVEHLRPDIHLLNNVGPDHERSVIEEHLRQGRAVYLLRPRPELRIAHWPQGPLWQIGVEPPMHETKTITGSYWEGGIELVEVGLRAGPYRPGDVVPLRLVWQANATPPGRYTLFVHLVDAAGRMWGQHDLEPAEAPTNQWQAGKRYSDLYGPTLAPDAPPGRYRVVIGWYEYPSFDRPDRVDEQGRSLRFDETVVGEIEVVPKPTS